MFGISVVLGDMGMKEISAYCAKYAITPVMSEKVTRKITMLKGAAVGWDVWKGAVVEVLPWVLERNCSKAVS